MNKIQHLRNYVCVILVKLFCIICFRSNTDIQDMQHCKISQYTLRLLDIYHLLSCFNRRWCLHVTL